MCCSPLCIWSKFTCQYFGYSRSSKIYGDNADTTDPLAEDCTTIKSGNTKSHLIWDYGRHDRYFRQGSSQIPELYLYVGHIYFTYFCTIGHNFFFDKFHFAFSSAYYIDPYTLDATHPYGPHAMPYVKGYLYGEEPHNQWYCPEISNITHQSIDSNPKPTTQVTWSDDTKPPASSVITTPYDSRDFQLDVDLTYHYVMWKSVALVC